MGEGEREKEKKTKTVEKEGEEGEKDEGTAIPSSEGDAARGEEGGTGAGVNVQLYNALTSSQNALASLGRMARGPAPTMNPDEEMKRIEADLLGSSTSGAAGTGAGGIGGGSVGVGGGGTDGKTPSVVPRDGMSAGGTPARSGAGLMPVVPGVRTSTPAALSPLSHVLGS